MSIAKEIEQKIKEQFNPSHLQVINESHQHNVPKGSESHFKLVVVSDVFNEQKLIKRHQLVNGVLGDIIGKKIHALALHTLTQDEWQANQAVRESPNCLGGSALEKKS